jgi:YD repeat-containing protein
MTTIDDAFTNALLADATYVHDLLPGWTGPDLYDALKERMTPTLAQYISDNFSVVTQFQAGDIIGSGFDVTVWRQTTAANAGKLYISMRGTEPGQDLFITDADLAVTGNAQRQLVDMVNWWLRVSTPTNQGAPQIQWNGSLYVGAPLVPGEGLVSAPDLSAGVEVDGHSLGGYLAAAFTRLFGIQANVGHTSTFNSAGFAAGSEAAFINLSELIGPSMGLGRFPNTSEQTNYFAQNGLNFTTNSFYFNQQGKRVELFNELDSTQLGNHFIYKLTDSLALGNALSTLDSTFTIGKLNLLLAAGSNDTHASIEGLFDGVRRLLQGNNIAPTPVGDVDKSAPSRTTYQSTLADLQDTDLFKALVGKVTVQLAVSSDLAAQAKSDFSAFLSLQTLSPIFLKTDTTGQAILKQANESLAQQWEADQSLTQAQRDAGLATFTDNWMSDRAAYLAALERYNSADAANGVINDPLHSPNQTIYTDATTSASLAVRTTGSDPRRYVKFGDDTAETLLGEGLDDHLYGGNGDDTLNGQSGNDYLEGDAGNDSLQGGEGVDTLVGGSGDDTLDGGAGNDTLLGGAGKNTYLFSDAWGRDTVVNSDGSGHIRIAGFDLASGRAIGAPGGVWEEQLLNDQIVQYRILDSSNSTTGKQLSITVQGNSADSIVVNNFDEDAAKKAGYLGIRLDDTPAVAIKQGAGPSFWGDIKANIASLAGQATSIAEGAGNTFTVYLNTAARAGETFVLHLADLAGKGIKAVLGDETVNADGATITLAEGQTEVSFALLQEGGLTADAAGSLSISYQTADGRSATSNGWDLNLQNHDDPTHSLTGDFAKKLADDGTHYALDTSGNYLSDGPSPGAQDILRGTADADALYGLGGNDGLSGMDGNDLVEGGDGDDLLLGGAGSDTINGGAGDDVILGSADGPIGAASRVDDPPPQALGPEISRGFTWVVYRQGDGNDYTVAGVNNLAPDLETTGNVIDGGAGNDRIGAGSADDLVKGGEGNDSIFGMGGADVLLGEAGDDHICGDGTGTLVNGSLVYATPDQQGADFIDGGEGNDVLFGQGNDDVLYGGDGNDRMWGDDSDPVNVPTSVHGNDYLDGEDGDDSIVGGGKDDTLYGGAGNDALWGDDRDPTKTPLSVHGSDYLDGEEGDDTLVGGGKDDTLYGGTGNDELWGDDNIQNNVTGEYTGNDYLDGEDGNDSVWGGGRDDTLYGGTGNDVLYGDDPLTDRTPEAYNGNDYLDGEEGDDTLVGGGKDDTLYGGTGNDVLWGDGGGHPPGEPGYLSPGSNGNDYLDGEEGDDQLIGEGGDDTLYGGAGADTLHGGEGNDYLDGEDDNDLINGDGGDDTVFGGAGTDQVQGGDGNDFLDGEDGDDLLLGDAGDDTLFGGTGNDQLQGADGNDELNGEDGDDVLFGEAGDDALDGGTGNDTLVGGDGNDQLAGGDGNDVLFGMDGDDTLDGGAGDDTLSGGGGDNELDGGDGDNVLVASSNDDSDTLTDSGGGGSNAFVINAGVHHVTVTGASGADFVSFGDGITQASVTGGSTDAGVQIVTLVGGTTLEVDGDLGHFQFADGSTLDSSQMATLIEQAKTANAPAPAPAPTPAPTPAPAPAPAGDGDLAGTTITNLTDSAGNPAGSSVKVSDGHGNIVTTVYAGRDGTGTKQSDTWTRADHTRGNDTFNSDGSSTGTAYFVDGTSSTYADDGHGDRTQIAFDAQGHKTGDSWTQADGAYGNDAFAGNGSSSGFAHKADGSYSIYTDDGRGHRLTANYDAQGNLVPSVSETNFPDGSYRITVDDGLGNITSAFFGAGGVEISDSWMKSDGSHGSDTFGSDGSSTGTAYRPDGSYSTSAKDGQGQTVTTNYSWGGDRTGSSVTEVNGLNSITTFKNAAGVKVRESWVHADGTSGDDLVGPLDFEGIANVIAQSTTRELTDRYYWGDQDSGTGDGDFYGGNGRFGNDWEFPVGTNDWADGFISVRQNSDDSISDGEIRTSWEGSPRAGVDLGFDWNLLEAQLDPTSLNGYGAPQYPLANYLLYDSVVFVDGFEGRDGNKYIYPEDFSYDGSGWHLNAELSVVSIQSSFSRTFAGHNGAYAILKDDGQGNVMLAGYKADGTQTDDAWFHNDGSNGVELFHADGSINGVIANPDGTTVSYTRDGQGHVVTRDYPGADPLVKLTHDAPGPIDPTPGPGPGPNGTLPPPPPPPPAPYSTTFPDGHGGNSRVFFSQGTPTMYHTDAQGHVSIVDTDPGYGASVVEGANTLGWSYDAAGKPTSRSVDDGHGTVVTYLYDAQGHVSGHSTATTDAQGAVTIQRYDAAGHPSGSSIRTPAGQGQTTTSNYDVSGRLISAIVDRTDGLGDTITSNYDASGALVGYIVRKVTGSNQSTVSSYDARNVSIGTMITSTSSQGVVETDNYDGSGKLTGSVVATAGSAGNVNTGNYDAGGALTSYVALATDAQGDTVITAFDNQGRKVRDDTLQPGGGEVSTSYQSNGSSIATTYAPDGSSSTLARSGAGDVVVTRYSSQGAKLSDSWTKQDGSNGVDTFYADGTASGSANYADGTRSTSDTDAHGTSTTTHYDAGGAVTGSTVATHGPDETRTVQYDTHGNPIGDSWAKIDGSSGTDIWNSDGSISSTRTDANGAFTESTSTPGATNHAPVLATAPMDQSAAQDGAFSYAVPANTFNDPDAGDVLAYTASAADGSALPAWLNFNAATRTFSGTPQNADVGSLSLKIVATDIAGASANCVFKLTVADVNDAPVLVQAVAGQAAVQDQAWTFTLPAGTFTDPDLGDTLSYSATLASGAALPSWLTFDGTTRTFRGVPLNANVGALSLEVTATDGQGLSTSDAFALTVANINDAPTGSVTISGAATQGQTLTAANTLADADGLGTISYQWMADGANISGATGSTLVLTQAQVGKAIGVVASYDDGFGASESVASGATATVVNVNDAPTGSVTIGGTATQGQTLTAANTLADADGLGAISYQWRADGENIGGATASTLVLTQVQVGKAISVVAGYTDAGGAVESVVSSLTATVANVNDAPTGSVTISGTAAQGQTLTASNTLVDADGLGTIGYQWKADGVNIGGATAATLVLTQVQVGKAISVVAGYTDAGGTVESVVSSLTAVVANVNDAPTGSVTISGTATQGQTLTAANTLADADGLGTIGYQWKADGVNIGGATASTLVLTQAQVGKAITVLASYTDGFGSSESVASGATAAVLPLSQTLTGTSGNDSLAGGAGSDFLDGLAGADQMRGGAGDDTYVVDNTGDVVIENANEGFDTVISSITYTLPANVERLVLSGASPINATGNPLGNVLIGNSANNQLTGGAGDDTLDGGAGDDAMKGGAGDDAYYVDSTRDVVNELTNEGTDSVFASTTYTLNANVENLTLTGSDAINGTGNPLANVLTGNGGDNELKGGDGDDTLYGGAGKDVLNGEKGKDLMVGGSGDDQYFVADAGDTVVELAGGGIDTVIASISYTLSADLENLILGGGASIDGTGNAQNNVLTGNGGNNKLTGGAGNDFLNGAGGADTLVGGSGDDVYMVENDKDIITENVGEGIDTVRSSINFTLGANVENLVLTGKAANGTGNELDNVLTGNAAPNNLVGNAGNDTLDGAGGGDLLTGGAGNDTYLMVRGYGSDTIMENDATAGNTDVAQFGPNISFDQLWFRRSGTDNLEVMVIGTTDEFVIQHWFSGSRYHVEQFKTSDGKTLLDSQVQNLVNAMASFSPPAQGQTTLPSNYQSALGAVLAANWQ